MIEINLFIKLIELLGCPWCGSVGLECVGWREANGGFRMTVCCSSCQVDCQFSVKFGSTACPKHTQRHDAPSCLVFVWGLHGLGFEALESVFALSGGVLPISPVPPCPAMVVLILLTLARACVDGPH
jgi:hypothetical protein